jgi:hypothetical protein
VFRCQFEAVAGYNNWAPCTPARCLQGVLTEATNEEVIGALESRCGKHQLAELKARTQHVGEFLSAFATAIEKLTHRALVGPPEHYIHKAAVHGFIDGMRDRDMKQQLLMGGERTLSKALN